MPSWPATLPQYVEVPGYRERPGANVIRSPMDAGPAKQRRRGTAAPETLRVRLVLTKAQRATFVAFHREDLEDGALAFDWFHPVTRDPCVMRIVEGNYDLAAAGGKFFALELALEVLP